MLDKIQQCIFSEQFSLFNPVILGIGILIGVNFPNFYVLILFLILMSIFYKTELLRNTLLLLSIGFYVAQTGGIFKTGLLTDKKYLTHECTLPFEATVKYIDETHPVMKNMQRITFKNIYFTHNKNLNFIKTAKMTCSTKSTCNINIGDRVSVFGKLTPFQPPIAPFTFNPKQYYTSQGIDVIGVVFKVKKISQSETHDIVNISNTWRRTITRTIIDKLGAIIGGIASALITGDKSSIPTDIREVFIKSGTAHILAISGLHMSLVATIIYIVIFRIFLYISHFCLRINPQIVSSVLTIVLTGFYLILSGFSPSATRAYIMTSIMLIGIMLGRGVISMRNVSFAAMLLLIIDPGALFSISFQLSFSAVVTLISFYESCGYLLSYQNRFIKMFNYIIMPLATTVIATIATSPISIATFNRLSICGILGNAIAVPMISFLIIPIGLLCFITAGNLPWLVNIFSWVISKMITALTFCANLPYTDITIKSPHMMTLYIVIFGGIIVTLCKSKLKLIGLPVLGSGLILWIFEKNPICIILPEQQVICYTKNGKFYTNASKKGRNLVKSLARNYGYSTIEKDKCITFNKIYSSKIYFIWENGNIKTLSNPKHPYAPVRYIN